MILAEADWRQLERRHTDRVEPWIRPRLERRMRGHTHPIDDFLFEYYPYRPGQLAQWHPGIGVLLDWVPSHFPYDAHGLFMFDGTRTYEYADMRKGFHPDWNSYIFNTGTGSPNIGTAFRPPSLCELNAGCYGNPNLLPETSINWDAGLEQEAPGACSGA